MEILTERFLPTLRSLVVQRLLDGHGMKQTEVARAMGLTQAAVSHYRNNARGRDADVLARFPELHDYADDIAGQVAAGASEPQQVAAISAVCDAIRRSPKFCDFHLETSRYEGACDVCFEPKPNVAFLKR